MALIERNHGSCSGSRYPYDINAVEIISLPIRDDRRIATVIRDEKAGQLCDVDVLPGHNHKSALVDWRSEFVPESVEIRDTDAGVDW